MRWSMLPVSIAAHVVLFAVVLILPLAGSLEAPTAQALSSVREFIAAAPAPPPRQVEIVRTSSPRRTAAPVQAPNELLPPDDSDSPAVGAEGTDGPGGPAIGIPAGIALEDFDASPVTIVPPPPPPAMPRAYRTGGAIREPRKVRDVPAVYPDIARAAKIEGEVALEATIDERGVVVDARVLRSVPLLDAAALSALKQWRYTPTLLNGVPIRVLMTVTFRFSLGERDL